jgi:hypothetical protein
MTLQKLLEKLSENYNIYVECNLGRKGKISINVKEVYNYRLLASGEYDIKTEREFKEIISYT